MNVNIADEGVSLFTISTPSPLPDVYNLSESKIRVDIEKKFMTYYLWWLKNGQKY